MQTNEPQKPEGTLQHLTKRRDSVFTRFPLVFTLLGTFGVTTTYYGIGHILDKIPLFTHNPFIPLIVGLALLIFTGTLYKRLG